jgi:hypothetical protein
MSVAEQNQYTDNSGIIFLQQGSMQEEFVCYSCKLRRSKLVKGSSPINDLNKNTIQCNIHEVIYFIAFTYSAYVDHLQKIYIKRNCFKIIIYNSFSDIMKLRLVRQCVVWQMLYFLLVCFYMALTLKILLYEGTNRMKP